ncbi:MAG: peroxidase-related enzyme [Planctomycetales bacterium]|nr:peroxidase-related enzyme [Planctomycetales bacterium]
MSRLPQIDSAQAPPKQAELFAAVEKKLGRVPNLVRVIGNSTAALRGYLEFSAALGGGAGLDPQQREVLAITVAQANGCGYCLAAHCTIAKSTGLSAEAISGARTGSTQDDVHRALIQFTNAVIERRGRVDDSELAAFRAAGFSDEAVVEVVAHVSINVFTNYLNNLAETEIDFPAVPELPAAEPAAACSTSQCVSA